MMTGIRHALVLAAALLGGCAVLSGGKDAAVGVMSAHGFNACTGAQPQAMLGKDGTFFSCGFRGKRFHFEFDVADTNVCVASEIKHPLDIAAGDRVEIYFVPDAAMACGYRCAEIDAAGRVLSYSVDEAKKFDWFWKFSTLKSKARRTAAGYRVEGSVAVDELVSFGIDPASFFLGVFRADMSAPGKVAAWCSLAPMLLPAHFHQPAMLLPFAPDGGPNGEN